MDKSTVVNLIDLLWLIAALGAIILGCIYLIKWKKNWKKALLILPLGLILMGARFLAPVWDFIHNCVNS